MVADPVLVRLGNQDRVQVAVFYLDDCDVTPDTEPQFRLFCEGEIVGWSYRNTSAGRSIVFSCKSHMAIWGQTIVQFLTNVNDMYGHATEGTDPTEQVNATSQLVYPLALFTQGLVPDANGARNFIVRPFDYLYNCVKGLISSVVPNNSETVPAANFFSRWARLTNLHNKFVASPFFDEVVDNTNIFPVLRALQDVSAVDVITKNLIPQLQGAGTIWDLLRIVYTTMLMEVAMIPSMPLVNVDLASSLIQQTNFNAHGVVDSFGSSVTAVLDDSRKTSPLRIPNYFVKPQSLFGIPPACNVVFPSQLKTVLYEENYATQPTRLYFNDETVSRIVSAQKKGVSDAITNSLAVGYPQSVDDAMRLRGQFPHFNTKNFLVYPEEFYKGPVLIRTKAPPWLFFLRQSQNNKGTNTRSADGGAASAPPPATQTANTARPVAPPNLNGPVMQTTARVGTLGPTGQRTFSQAVEKLRTQFANNYQTLTGIPVDLQLAWIENESEGQLGETTSLNERGYFQIMGPHGSGSSFQSLRDVEAGAVLGLGTDATGASQNTPNSQARLSNDPAFSYQQGIRLLQAYRKVADHAAHRDGLDWTEGDMWRLTKLYHNSPILVNGTPSIMAQASHALGRPPLSWEEMFNTVKSSVSSTALSYLKNATGVGGVVASASGQMTTANDPRPVSAPPAQQAPGTPNAATTRVADAQPTPAASVTPQQQDAANAAANDTSDVYRLYAKYEFFRARYAKRSGSATIVWNPYVVPGFPMALFDQRATRVDLFAYVTGVTQTMTNDGQRGTTLSFMYGRQFQEMFADLRDEFLRNDATARGSAPQEPLREVSKVVQSFIQSETYYQDLFYGAQQLFGKDASFDFRKIVGYAPGEPGGTPETIFVNGPDVASQDAADAANTTIANLTPKLTDLQATITDIKSQIAVSQAIVDSTDPNDLFDLPLMKGAQDDVAALQQQLAQLNTQLTSLSSQINAAQSALATANAGSTGPRVQHNLDPTKELVPLSTAEDLFANRDAAMRYNWRPICTLDEYITFYNSSGENVIPAFGHKRSVGAKYYERIRTFTPPIANFSPPDGITGVGVTSVPSLTNTNFPQVAQDWDEQLLAYKDNVLNNQAPRT